MALVWYSSWQMECCGDPFAVGDTVDWDLAPSTDLEWRSLDSALRSSSSPREERARAYRDAARSFGLVAVVAPGVSYGGRTVAARLPPSRRPSAPLRGACGGLDCGTRPGGWTARQRHGLRPRRRYAAAKASVVE